MRRSLYMYVYISHSQQCTDKALSDKTVYPTFVRTQPPSEKIAKSIAAALEHFHWSRVVVVMTNNTIYAPINDAFQVSGFITVYFDFI